MNLHENSMITLGEAIRFARERKGVSARQVSQEAGLSPTYVSKVERGDMEPSLKAFGRIAIVLGLSDVEVNLLVRLHANEAS